MTLTRYLAHLPRWGVEVAVALEDGTQSPSRHCYHYPLSSLPASRLLIPRNGLERSDFVLWHL